MAFPGLPRWRRPHKNRSKPPTRNCSQELIARAALSPWDWRSKNATVKSARGFLLCCSVLVSYGLLTQMSRARVTCAAGFGTPIWLMRFMTNE